MLRRLSEMHSGEEKEEMKYIMFDIMRKRISEAHHARQNGIKKRASRKWTN